MTLQDFGSESATRFQPGFGRATRKGGHRMSTKQSRRAAAEAKLRPWREPDPLPTEVRQWIEGETPAASGPPRQEPASHADRATLPAASAPISTFHATWEAYRSAEHEDSTAATARIVTAKAISDTLEGSERSNWPAIHARPEMVALVEAERIAHAQAHEARLAMTQTPAADWLGWSRKFQVVREHADDLLNPLDLRDRTAKYGDGFRGSKLAADLHHYALAAHLGEFEPKYVREIPRLVAKLADKVTQIDVSIPTTPASSADEDVVGFRHLYLDAERLTASPRTGSAGEHGARAANAGAAKSSHHVTAKFEHWASERDRLSGEAAAIHDNGPLCTTEGLERQRDLDRRSAAFEMLIRNTPCDSAEAAVAKLKWIAQSFEDGETGDEQRVMDQVTAFLQTGPRASPHPDAELLALAPELERRWEIERAFNKGGRFHGRSDEEMEAAVASVGEIAHRIHDMPARTLDGFRIKARAVAWHRNAHDRPYLEEGEHSGTDNNASSRLIDALLEAPDVLQPRDRGNGAWIIPPALGEGPGDDAELIALLPQWQAAERVMNLLVGWTIGADLGFTPAMQAAYDRAKAERDELLERSRQMRATTSEGIRVKAILALDWQPTSDFDGFEDTDVALTRSLIADVLKMPSTEMLALDLDAWRHAHGVRDEETEDDYRELVAKIEAEAPATVA